MSSWSAWTDCNKSCGIGERTNEKIYLISKNFCRRGRAKARGCAKTGPWRFQPSLFYNLFNSLHFCFRVALPSPCRLQMVRIRKELQDRLLQMVTGTIFGQCGDSARVSRRRMCPVFAKQSGGLQFIKFLHNSPLLEPEMRCEERIEEQTPPV